MNGQMTIFDVPRKNIRPCEYSFQRYIGQVVRTKNGQTGKVTKISAYYTDIETEKGDVYIGTPTTITPIEQED